MQRLSDRISKRDSARSSALYAVTARTDLTNNRLRCQGFFVALINQTKRKYNNASNMGFATLKWPLESAGHR